MVIGFECECRARDNLAAGTQHSHQFGKWMDWGVGLDADKTLVCAWVVVVGIMAEAAVLFYHLLCVLV